MFSKYQQNLLLTIAYRIKVPCDYSTLSEDGCALDDFECHCVEKTGIIAEIIVPCLAQSSCAPIDIGAFAGTVDDVCAYYNATSNGTCPSAAPSPTTLSGPAAVAATSHTTFTSFAPSVIPPNFSPSATKQLLMSFQTGTVQVRPGEQLGVDVPAASGHQQIGLSEIPVDDQIVETPPAASIYQGPIEVYGPQLYLVAMVDPDAPAPYNPYNAQYLHWLQPNMRLINASTLPPYAIGPFPFLLFANETGSTPAVATYQQPNPPTYSPPHRYIILVFQQPLNFTVPEAYRGYSDTNRTNFDVGSFASAASLGDPIAANYFYTGNGTRSISANATGPVISSPYGVRPTAGGGGPKHPHSPPGPYNPINGYGPPHPYGPPPACTSS